MRFWIKNIDTIVEHHHILGSLITQVSLSADIFPLLAILALKHLKSTFSILTEEHNLSTCTDSLHAIKCSQLSIGLCQRLPNKGIRALRMHVYLHFVVGIS